MTNKAIKIILTAILSYYCAVACAQSMFDLLFSDTSSDMPALRGELGGGQKVVFRWEETTKEHILFITPNDAQDIPLDIKIQDGLVRVSGKIVKQERVERDGVKSTSSYLSQFSLAEGIPAGADEAKGKITQAGQSIKIAFPKRPRRHHQSPPKAKARGRFKDLSLPGERI